MPVAEEYDYPAMMGFGGGGMGLNVDDANEQMINQNQIEGDLSSTVDGDAAETEKYKQPVVGIIYPPPEVRNIVDKTASFVARNGPEFESRIKLNEQNNPKFNFLSTGDPYHAYYQHKVREIAEGKLPATAAQSASVEVPFQKLQLDEAKKKRQSDLLKQVELPFIPREPPNDFEYISDPPSIAAIDLDIVKLTALFVARNGRQFLSSLMTREQRNYQFDFLRPQHSLFQYFTKLLEQYTKVLIPPKDIVKKLMFDERKKILDDVKYRANWIKHQEAVKKKEEEASEKERMAYACIDWHDFVVVETVDYQPYESGHFPPPTNPQEVGARVLMQDRILLGEIEPDKNKNDDDSLAAQDDIQVQDMDEESSSSEDEDQPLKSDHDKGSQMLPPIAESLSQDHVIIKKGYDPKQAKTTQEKVVRPMPGSGYTISPITGERIPVSKVAEHFRIGLLDPRWKEQRDRQLQEKANQESVFAPGSAIEDSLKQLADRRSDIFGVGVEETPIGKKVEEREPGRPWDPSAEIHIISRAGNMGMGMEDNSDNMMNMMKDKNETIGPSLNKGSVISSGPQPPSSSGGMQQQPPQGLPPQLSTISGIIRPNPPPMLMRPLLGHPGHPGHPGGYPPFPPMHRQPLLPPHMLPPHHPHHQQQHQQPPPPQQQQQQQMMSLLNPVYGDDEPVAKKAKNLEDSLVDEVTFLATNPPTSQFGVAVPGGKPEMGLHGQLLSFTLPITDSVTSLKSKISEAIGLAPSKQKLRLIEGLFFKDSNSLAFYNIGNGATVHLSLKERGGRKK